MKQIPILFSSAMVRAILEERKLQTRRVVKPQPEPAPAQDGFMKVTEFLAELKRQDKAGRKQIHTEGNGKGLMFPNCPYGRQPGDVLWVRETFCKWHNNLGHYFMADELYPEKYGEGKQGRPNDYDKVPWKPSIHMPKKAARIWLEVVNVRVERLHEISEDDAIKEGVQRSNPGVMGPHKYVDYMDQALYLNSARASFGSLWHKINGKESWDANPWVWVVEFKVLSTNGKPEGIE